MLFFLFKKFQTYILTSLVLGVFEILLKNKAKFDLIDMLANLSYDQSLACLTL